MSHLKITKILLSAALSLPLWGTTHSFNEYSRSNPEKGMHVVGRAEKIVQSDRAILKITLSVLDNCLKEANDKLNRQIKELKESWIAMGLKNTMINIKDPVTIVSDLAYDGHKKNNKYSISCDIVLTIDNVELAPDFQNKTNSFIEKGFIFSQKSLDYQYTQVAKLQKELAKQALAEGQKTAQDQAQSLGLSIGSTPICIQSSLLLCDPLYLNHVPYEMTYNWGSKDLVNKFSVLVKMTYPLINPSEKTQQKTEETTANL